MEADLPLPTLPPALCLWPHGTRADWVPYGGWGTLGGWAEAFGSASIFLGRGQGSGAEFLPSWSIPLWML